MNGNYVGEDATERRYERLSIDTIEKLINRNHKLYLAPDGSVTITPHSLAAIEDRSADLERLLEERDHEVQRLSALINTPETTDFLEGVKREAAHQRERWGAPHDREKSAEHWYWLVGYLAGKALRAAISGNADKARHHTISSAAALLHWHTAISQDDTGTGAGRDADLQAHDDGRQAHETSPVSI
jgi:hypothetical protein